MVFDQDSTDEDPQTEATDRLLALSRRIGSRDAKFDLFEETLRKALAEQAGSKALVFSFFRRTLEYLSRRLRDLGYQVDVIHGGVLIPD
jgi:superfamily II DNA/RNA helicase